MNICSYASRVFPRNKKYGGKRRKIPATTDFLKIGEKTDDVASKKIEKEIFNLASFRYFGNMQVKN